ncbi:MAG: molybdopterin-binding protein [Notoacmeibacter sp.]
MKFGVFPVSKCEGATLAHSLAVGEARFSKGQVLSADDIMALQSAGHKTISVAKLGKHDVPENEAAARIGAGLTCDNSVAKTASTGRVNLHASYAGLFRVSAKKINAINAIDPSITIATLPDFAVCKSNTMVATVKIIPFAAPQSAVEKAELFAAKALTVFPFQPLRIGLVQTTLELTKDSVLEKTIEVTRQRIAELGGTLDVAANCNHDANALADTLGSLLGLDIVIVFGASAVCDIEDVIPSAIRLVGGKVTQFGMPVDPGNLLVLGKKGKTKFIGAPGCARSPKENGFDWVLARLFAGLKVTSRDIIGMGVGGLLMEIPTRPSPRGGSHND